MRFAYFVFPHLGGTFSVYRHLRAGLAPKGIDVEWVGCGTEAHRAMFDPAWSSERAYGAVVGLPDHSPRQLGEALAAHLQGRSFDGVFVNVFADQVQTNVVRYLPQRIRRIMIVHSITPATYAAARAIRDNVHATIGVSRRIADDLVTRYRFDRSRTFAIGNAANLSSVKVNRVASAGPLKLLFLGRIEDQAKGVFWLPQIQRQLPAGMRMTIAGDGPDLKKLKALCADLGDRMQFLGAVEPERARALQAAHDIMVMPSRFEGFPIALVEAMAQGCVPVVSAIRGVTDTVVENGRTGLLFPVGDTAAAARAIQQLAGSPSALSAMSHAACDTVRTQFGVEAMADRYHEVICRVEREPGKIAAPLPFDSWRIPMGLQPGLRTFLPTPIKNALRTFKERHAL